MTINLWKGGYAPRISAALRNQTPRNLSANASVEVRHTPDATAFTSWESIIHCQGINEPGYQPSTPFRQLFATEHMLRVVHLVYRYCVSRWVGKIHKVHKMAGHRGEPQISGERTHLLSANDTAVTEQSQLTRGSCQSSRNKYCIIYLY